MKTKFTLLILALFAVSSCSDQDSPLVTPVVPPSSSFTASIDGVKWESESAEAFRFGQTIIVQGHRGSSAEEDKFSIALRSDDWRLGEHGIGTLGTRAFVNQILGEETRTQIAEELGSGSIVVTKNDRKELTGHFSFTAKAVEGDDTIIVTDGVFGVKFDIRELPAGTITEDAKLLAEDGIKSDSYGLLMAFDDGVIAVAAQGRDRESRGQPAVYLVDSSSGEQMSKLVPSDLNLDKRTSLTIAIGDGIVAAGLTDTKYGSVTLYDVQSGQKTRVLRPDPAVDLRKFGRAVAIDNDLLAVSATDPTSGKGIILLYEVHSGTLVNTINLEDGYLVGRGFAMSEGILAATVLVIRESGQHDTEVRIFEVETGLELMVLELDDPSTETKFGETLAISDSKITITARSSFAPGAVYIFDLITGDQLQKIEIGEGVHTGFGSSISFDSGLLVVGESSFREDPPRNNMGTAYVFDATSGQLIVQLLPSDDGSEKGLGSSVAIAGGKVYAGAFGDNDKGVSAGAVYGFDLK